MSSSTGSRAAARPAGYSAAQIILHWVIAAMIVFQVLMGEQIGPAWQAFRKGVTPSEADLFAANVHVAVGIGVFVLAVFRIFLRVTHGAPPAPPGQGRLQTGIVNAVHGLLYFIMLAMPLSGAIAWFGAVQTAAEIHELAKPVIILAILLHVAGALLQHFVRRTDVLKRMTRPA